jgi:hypothetical protein
MEFFHRKCTSTKQYILHLESFSKCYLHIMKDVRCPVVWSRSGVTLLSSHFKCTWTYWLEQTLPFQGKMKQWVTQGETWEAKVGTEQPSRSAFCYPLQLLHHLWWQSILSSYENSLGPPSSSHWEWKRIRWFILSLWFHDVLKVIIIQFNKNEIKYVFFCHLKHKTMIIGIRRHEFSTFNILLTSNSLLISKNMMGSHSSWQ